jgi:hypothetical protein
MLIILIRDIIILSLLFFQQHFMIFSFGVLVHVLLNTALSISWFRMLI